MVLSISFFNLLVLLLLRVLSSAAFQTLSDNTLKSLPSANDDFDIKNGSLLAPILRPRVPGTPGSLAVLQHFVDFFSEQLPDWDIAYHNSTATTPATGDEQVPFRNLIVTRDPPWAKPGDVGRLTLVAHYDSLMTPEGFIGAIDSAAPCAMLMHVARSLDTALTRKWEDMEKNGETGLDEERGIQLLFLDGEEAFVQWSATDSIYGARALAESWEHEMHPAMSTFKNSISSISLFVLLDLLGSKLGGNVVVQSYFKTTHWAYQAMAKLESRFRELKQFESSPNHPKHKATRADNKDAAEPLFMPESEKKNAFIGGAIGDDHMPFLERGVEVLHLIPTRFPDVWHTMDDDGEHLDLDTVKDWAQLVTAFAGEWLELEGFFDSLKEHANNKRWDIPISKTEL